MYLGHVWAYLICHKWLFLCVQIMMNVQCMGYAAKPARTPTGRIAVAAQMATDCSPTDIPAKPNRVRLWWIHDWKSACFSKLCKALLLVFWVQTPWCHMTYWYNESLQGLWKQTHHSYKTTITHWSIIDLLWILYSMSLQKIYNKLIYY